MNTKYNLVISGLVGGVIGSLFTALLVSPVTAQRDKFGEIECRSLRVVDKHGQARVLLTTELFDMANDFSSGELWVMILGTRIGAYVVTYGKNGEAGVNLNTRDDGGSVSVFDKQWVSASGSQNKVRTGKVLSQLVKKGSQK